MIAILTSQVQAGLTISRRLDAGAVERPGRQTCPADLKSRTVSISTGLGYDGKSKLSPNTYNDASYFQSMAKGYSGNVQNWSDQGPSRDKVLTKTAYLKALREAVANSDYVNFNYSGHGTILPNGQMALVLPGSKRQALDQCMSREGQSRALKAKVNPNFVPPPTTGGTPADPCANLKEQYVTAQDLRDVFRGKKVFGIIDACHAGAFDLGPNASMLLSSQGNQTSSNGPMRDGNENGSFTTAIRRTLDQKIFKCKVDFDGDGATSFHEMSTALRHVAPEYRASGARNQDPLLNQRDWTSCFQPENTNTFTNACWANGYQKGEVAKTTTEMTLINRDNARQECRVAAGTYLPVTASAFLQIDVPVRAPAACGFTNGIANPVFLAPLDSAPVPVETNHLGSQ